MEMGKRVFGIIFKWAIAALIFIVIAGLGIFNIVFALVLLLVEQFQLFFDWLETGTDLGAQNYWDEYGSYWMLGYLFLGVMLTLIYFIPYRKVRPVLKVGDRREGIVTFIKGLRRGVSYEVWDVYNYLKKTKPTPMGWPNPLAVPRGPPTKSGICIVYRPLWSLKTKCLYIPDTLRLDNRLLSIHVPDGYFENRPNPKRLDVMDLVFVDPFGMSFDRFDPERPKEMHKEHLKKSRKMVQRSVASNPEINQMDFTTGSFAVLGSDDD